MSNLSENTWAVVTGASRGLGRAIAFELGARGFSLFLVARSESELSAFADLIKEQFGVQTLILTLDLTQPDSADKLKDTCLERGIHPTILVNNAGIGVYDRFHVADRHAMARMNLLNVDAVVNTTYALLPLLLNRRKAYIMNVGSAAAFQPVPFMALYAAGKAYVRSFSFAVRHELKGSPVSVTCLSPGGVWTDFMAVAGSEAVSEKNKRFMMSAERCARAAVEGMLKGKAEVIPGWYNVLAAFMTRFTTTRFSARMAARIFAKD
jgi:short-subunit dehydrogenase